LTTAYRTAMRRKRNLSRSDGYALKSRWWGISPPECSPLLASPESVDAATGCLTPRRQGRTRTGAAVIIRRDQHVHRGTGLVLLAAR
jgi:hypothetical protein